MTNDIATDPPSWFETSASDATSSIALGCVLIIIGASVLTGGYSAGLRNYASTEFFPAIVAVALVVTGAVLVVLSKVFSSIAPLRWGWPWLAIACVAVAAAFANTHYYQTKYLFAGPAEQAIITAVPLVLVVALAVRSHLRALGMALIGLLLGSVGIDPTTGQLRFIFGLEGLADGIEITAFLFGLFIVADAALVLVSPRLWLATLSFVKGEWQRRPVSASAGLWLRVAAVIATLVIGAVCQIVFFTNWVGFDLAILILAAVFGLICKLLGWNRLPLAVCFLASALLERQIRISLAVSDGSPGIFFREQIGFWHILFCTIVVLAAFSFWVWRVKNWRPVGSASPARQ